MAKLSPFDFLQSINSSKEDIMVSKEEEKDYNAFLVNYGLSMTQDTVAFANEMNFRSKLDGRLQYDFLINTVRKKKRFSKWVKKDDQSYLDAVKKYYGYSNEKARQVLTLLNEQQLELLRNKVKKGGRKNN